MVRPGPFAWPEFFTALLVLCTWALFAGIFFAWLLKRLTR